ncbi:MAG: hypothetical protein EOM26_02175 [Alphaproteobacteria bacterium]|nr:hypothetical protein [Alphaproteobacteria bacterium]
MTVIVNFNDRAGPGRYAFTERERAELQNILGLYRENGVLAGCEDEMMLVGGRPVGLVNFYSDRSDSPVTDIVVAKVRGAGGEPAYICEYFVFRGGVSFNHDAQYASFDALATFLRFHADCAFGTRNSSSMEATEKKGPEIHRPEFGRKRSGALPEGLAPVVPFPGVNVRLPGDGRQGTFTRAELEVLAERLEEGKASGHLTHGVVRQHSGEERAMYVFMNKGPFDTAIPLRVAKRIEGVSAVYTLVRRPGLCEGEGQEVAETMETGDFEEVSCRLSDYLAEAQGRDYGYVRAGIEKRRAARQQGAARIDFHSAAEARGHDLSPKGAWDDRNSLDCGIFGFGASIARLRPIFTPHELHAISVRVQQGRAAGLFDRMERSRIGMVDSVILPGSPHRETVRIEKDVSLREPVYRLSFTDSTGSELTVGARDFSWLLHQFDNHLENHASPSPATRGNEPDPLVP